MTDMMRRLSAPRDAAALAVFRMAFGALVTVSAVRFLVYGWIETLFNTRVQLHYWGFEWVPWPGLNGVYALFVAVTVLGALVAVGLFYRVAIVLLFVCFAWLQLLDVSTYLNHYYLVVLLALLLCFLPLHRYWSVDVLRRPLIRSETLPFWCTALLRFQVGTVYFFAGLAKLQGDWLLHGSALHLWLSARTSLPVIGPLLELPSAALFMAWAGFLFDTTVPFWLLWRRTRPFAYVAVIVFHTATRLLFPIGMFPFIMTLSALVFFDSSWPRRWLRQAVPVTAGEVAPLRRGALVAIAVYCLVQLVLPLRAHFYGGDVSWHEQGMRFSWRVMTREKNGAVTYVVRNDAGREWHVSPREYLTRVQERELAVQPDLILQLAHRIGAEWNARGDGPVRVYADSLVSLNGRRAAPLIDREVDLMTVRDTFAPKAWILPLREGPPLSASAKR